MFAMTEAVNLIADDVAQQKLLYQQVQGIRHARFNTIIAQFKSYVDKRGKVLDYGCGRGLNSYGIAEMGFDVTGIDYDDFELSIARKAWGDAPVKGSLVFENQAITDFSSSEFDYVLSNQVIEHVHNPGNYLSEINRVLDLGGVLVISIPNIMTPQFIMAHANRTLKEGLIQESERMHVSYSKSMDHIMAWDSMHFVRLVSTVGFRLLDYVPMEGIRFPKKLPIIKRELKKQHWYTENIRIKNYSYTMLFKFQKVANVMIAPLS